jgi:two-component system LytT family sensor kinase
MKDEPFLRRSEGPNWLRVWSGLLILWTIFAALGSWFNHGFEVTRGHPITWVQSICMNLFGYGIWAVVLTPLVLFCCARMPLARNQSIKIVSAHLLAIAVTVWIDVLIKTQWGANVFPNIRPLPFAPQFQRIFFSEAEADIQIYLVVAVIGYVVAYFTEIRGQEWRAAQLETNLVRAELQVLKMQLQPHFLFNTLHSVAALVDTDPRAAKKMICSLGDLLRMSLVSEDSPEATLQRELSFLERYLDIQRVRFQDRLMMEIRVTDGILDAKVPYLLLQQLVENAIKHGVARRPGCGRVAIDVSRQAEDVCILVVNDSGTSHVPDEDRLGIGLENIRSRLRMLHGFRGRLVTEELSDGRFQVEVRLPFQAGVPAERNHQPVAAA